MTWRRYAKAVVPGVATGIAIAVQWIVTGEFDRAELVTTLTGIGTTLLAYSTPNVPPTS